MKTIFILSILFVATVALKKTMVESIEDIQIDDSDLTIEEKFQKHIENYEDIMDDVEREHKMRLGLKDVTPEQEESYFTMENYLKKMIYIRNGELEEWKRENNSENDLNNTGLIRDQPISSKAYMPLPSRMMICIAVFMASMSIFSILMN